MNSAASLKAFVGEHDGIVCTSSNAAKTFDWAFERGEKILFFPDQHLGRNTGSEMGIPLDEMVLWNCRKPLGGNTTEQIEHAKVILWKGHCTVHQRFTVEQIEKARARTPGRQRHRPPGDEVGGRPGGRHERLDREHRQDRQRGPGRHAPGPSAPRSTWSTGWRTRTRTRTSSASTRWSAPAARCTASTRPTSPGCSKTSSPATSSTRSRSTTKTPQVVARRPRADARAPVNPVRQRTELPAEPRSPPARGVFAFPNSEPRMPVRGWQLSPHTQSPGRYSATTTSWSGQFTRRSAGPRSISSSAHRCPPLSPS